MADLFGIVGVISLTIQITQVVVQAGLDWKDAPHDVKLFLAELRSLKTVLSETNTNLIMNPDFVEVFANRTSQLLSQLGPDAPKETDTKAMLAICQKNLQNSLDDLSKRAKGHRVGWERLKGAFLAKNTREAVENLHRQCQTLNNMVMVDTASLGAMTYKEVKDARGEQKVLHQDGIKLSSRIKDGVDLLNQSQEERHRQEEQRGILDWLTPIDYAPQQNDFIARRQQGTGQWLVESKEFQKWINQSDQTLFCPGMPGAGKTMITSIVVDYLDERYQSDASVGIAYLYCNFRRHQEQKPADLLTGLLKQLIQQQTSIPEKVKSIYERQ